MERRSFDEFRKTLQQRGYNLDMNNEFPLALPIYESSKRFHRKIFGYRIDRDGPLKRSVIVRLPQHPAHIFPRQS
jgi:hypothetical protein